MVVLSPNFAILASLSALAVVSMLPNAEAVAIPDDGHKVARGGPLDSLDGQSSSSPNARGADAPASPGTNAPVLPLPGLSKRRVVFGTHSEAKAKEHHLDERWDPLNPLLQLGKIWVGTGSPPHRRDVKIEGNNDHVHVSKHHRGNEDMVVTGDDEHVHLHRRSPEPRSHYHGDHEKMIVKGDHNHVNVHEKRDPRSHGHHHHHHGHHSRSLSGTHSMEKRQAAGIPGVSVPLLDKGSTLLVPASMKRRRSGPLGDNIILAGHGQDLVMGLKRQLGDDVILSGNGEALVMTTKRQLSTLSAFAEPEGVPGSIDIISNVANSEVGAKIASLVLSSAMGDSVLGNPDPFVLNASGTNRTEVYMVLLSDDTSSPDTIPANDASNSTSSASPSNSTAPSDTSASASPTFAPTDLSDPSTPADPSSPSNSTSSGNSTDSASPQYKRVALKIPLFDAESATMKAYCATFDPQPTAPSPLTVESCADGPMVAEHKSQVFAYDPSTGAIQPMWYDGGDDDESPGGDDDGDDGSDNTAGDDGGDDELPDNVSSVASDGGYPPPQPTPSPADVNGTMARIENLSNDLLNNNGLIQPPAPTMAAKAHAFVAADSYATAQNVTLMFTPTPPELSSQAANQEQQATPSSPADPAASSATSSATDSSSTSADSYPSYSSASTFSAASPSTTSSTIVSFAPASAIATGSSSIASASASCTSSDVEPTVASFSPASVGSAMSSLSSSPSSSATVTDSSSSATATLTATSSMDVDAMATDSAASSDASSTSTFISASALTTHTLGVEVFDPEATATSTSETSSLGAQAAPTSSSASSVVSSGAPSMTPVSTAPYEWQFKQGSEKRGFVATNNW